MKFQVTFKTPDAVDDAAKTAGEYQVSRQEVKNGPIEDAETVAEDLARDMKKFAGKWVQYGEYVTIEFDTVAGTAVVVPNGG